MVPPVLWLLDALPEEDGLRSLEPPQRRQLTLDAVKRLLLRESRVQPLVLVLEDLHWIDAETQALLDSLVESVPAAPMLLLVNYRPEYQPRLDSARPTIASSGSTPCRRRAPRNCSRLWSAAVPSSPRSSAC